MFSEDDFFMRVRRNKKELMYGVNFFLGNCVFLEVENVFLITSKVVKVLYLLWVIFTNMFFYIIVIFKL